MSKIGDLLEDGLHDVALFIKKILPSTHAILSFATSLVNNFKNFDDANPEVADIITKIIPGDTDDRVVAAARKLLPEVLIGLSLATAEANKTPDEIISDAITLIKSKAPEYTSRHYQDIWVILSNKLTDDGITQSDLSRLAQLWYDQTK